MEPDPNAHRHWRSRHPYTWLGAGQNCGRGAGRDLVRAVTRNLLPVQEVLPEEELVLAGVESALVDAIRRGLPG